MSHDEFYKRSPREFYNRLIGWHEETERQYKESWELERWAVFNRLSKKPDLKLPWDKKKSKKTKASKNIEDDPIQVFM